uniref:Uncharacterized protein n=1 Tax=Trichogramma kaykai TaxID=54128 RepID=A0ABD2XJW9_9HYME
MTDSDSSFDENFDEEIIIRNFKAESELILNDLLPQKSEERYKLTHQEFIEWQRNNNTTSMAENDLLVYFKDLAANLKPSTLWSRW